MEGGPRLSLEAQSQTPAEPRLHANGGSDTILPASALGRMRAFYTLFPYPNRMGLALPDAEGSLVAHAGFSRLLASGLAPALDDARALWKQHRTVRSSAASPQDTRDTVDARARLDALCGPFDPIALVGCGTDEPVLMRALHPVTPIEAIDLSPRSLAIARVKERRLKWARILKPGAPPLRGQTHHRAGDAADVLDASTPCRFAHIQCFGVLHHQPDPERLFASMVRALRSGGTLRLMVYAHRGRRLERRIQARYVSLWGCLSESGPSLAARARLLLTHARLHAWQTFQYALGHGGASLRFRYLGTSRATVADALLHPSDAGLPLDALRSLAARQGMRLVFCEAKSEESGWIAGFGDTRETIAAWRRIEDADACDALLSNVVAIFRKP